MTAPPPTSPTTPGFPGWRVVAGCFIVLATTAGLGFYGLGVYLNTFRRELGWDVSSISLATTLFFVVGGAVGVVVARLIAHHDARIVIVTGGVVGALALLALGRVGQLWQLYASYALFAVGFAAAGLVPVTTVVTRWFHARRSVALSVASTGLSAGGVLITPAAKFLLDERGLASATPWLAAAWLAGTVPVALWLVRQDPHAAGWLPDGVARVGASTASTSVTSEGLSAAPGGDDGYRAQARSRFFVAVTVGYVLVMGAQVGGIQQLVRLTEERTSKGVATVVTMCLAAASIVARLVGGRVVTRLAMIPVTVALALLQGVALVALAAAGSPVTIVASVVVFGATVGNLLMLQPLLIADHFGVGHYARLFSRSQFISTIGVAGGPLLLGLLRDSAGGYAASYAVAAACSLAGATVIATARRS